MSNPFLLPDGRRLRTHGAEKCAGRACPIHNPSQHPLSDAPLNWRGDRRLMERICFHGTGHPDPDHLAFVKATRGEEAAWADWVHGCCGCCGVTMSRPDIMDRIDDVLCCVVCGKELPPDRVSDDFCSDQHYRDWCQQRLGQAKPGESPAAVYEPAWATIHLDPNARMPVDAEVAAAARSPWRDALTIFWAFASELLFPWRR